MSETDRNGRPSVPWISAAANGALTYVAGYMLSFLLGMSLLDSLHALGVSGLPLPTTVATTFYGAHFVPAAFGDGTTANLALSPLGPGLVAPIAVAGLLAASGYYVAGKTDGRSLADSVAAGAALVVGYLPLVAVGAVYFATTVTTTSFGETTTVSVSFPLLRAVVLAGVAFPAAFGAFGGAVRFFVAGESAASAGAGAGS